MCLEGGGAIGSVGIKEHDVINRNINDTAFLTNVTLVGDDKCFFDVVAFICDKAVQGAMNGVILTGFYFDGHHR